MNTRLILLASALGLVIGLAKWWPELLQDATPAETQTQIRMPNYTFDNISLTTTNAAGQPYYRILAKTMIHYDDDDSAEFDKPVMRFFREGEESLYIASERGSLTSARDDIILWGAVHIAQPKTATRNAYTVNTHDLRVFPEKQQASTEQPGAIIGEKYAAHGVGADIDLLSGNVKLRHRATGVYEP